MDPIRFSRKFQPCRRAISALGFLLRLGALLMVGPQPAFAGEISYRTLPVMLTYFYAARTRGALSIDWSTGAETDNLGFNLYLESDRGRQKINDQMIPSTGFKKHDPQDYHIETSAGLISGKGVFYLEEVDILGRTQLHGPFELGEVNGKRLTAPLTDWQKINTQNDRLEAAVNAQNSQSVNKALQDRITPVGLRTKNSSQAAQAKATATTKPTSTTTPTRTATKTTKPKPSATSTATPRPPKKTATPRVTATATRTITSTATSLPTTTSTPVPIDTSVPPANTAIPVATDTAVPPKNDTPVPTEVAVIPATSTPEPTATEMPVPLPTDAPLPTTTNTPLPTDTPLPMSTNTPMPSDTPLPTATNMPVPAATNTPTLTPPPAVQIGDLLVSQTGIQRVSYADLLAAGLDLAGQPAADLALTKIGTPVPILVSGADTFGPGSTIEFFGQALDTLYTNTAVYSLSVDHASARRMTEDQMPADGTSQAASYYMETTLVNNNKAYDEFSTIGDPWYDTSMLVYASANSWIYTIGVDHYLAGAAPVSLQVSVYGGTDYNGAPDHHMVTSFNGIQLSDQTFNALNPFMVSAALAEGVLVQGSNALTLKLPGNTGKPADAICLDKYSVTYPRSFWAVNGMLKFGGNGGVYQVDNLMDSNVVVYRVTDGTPTRLEALGVTLQGGVYQVRFNGGNQGGMYYVTSGSALLTPGIRAARQRADITSGMGEYLIIAHPDFISGLAPLVQARKADGLAVRVVDVKDIYDQYSYGVVDPQAIKKYIAFAAQNMGTKYVLLVGDDTYDYKNYLKLGSISFIPSIYMPVANMLQYAPVDPKYVDLDGDNLPDLPIGRLAVRTQAELGNVISKTLAYEEKTYGKSGVFAADSSFSTASDGLMGKLPADWVNTRAYLDTLGVAQAHSTLLASLNAGVALTNYIGHSDDWEWTFSGLFNIYDGPGLTNFGRPTLILQEGCWSAYYVNPKYETLGDAMVNDRLQGAAGMFGSTMLASNTNEQAYGRLLIPLLTQPGMKIGQAELQAKHTLAVSNPGAVDVFLGTMLLGDPYLAVTQ